MAIVKHTEQRVGVFIDAQNLYHSAKNLFNKRVNFGPLLDDAVAGRKLIRAIAYVIASESKDESGFFDALVKRGIETREKDLQQFSSGAKKGDWDVGLAVDAITIAPKLDAVILMSGDGDFVPLVEYLKRNSGVQVEIVSFARSASAKLIESADSFIDLEQNAHTYLFSNEMAFGRKRATRRSPSQRKAK